MGEAESRYQSAASAFDGGDDRIVDLCSQRIISGSTHLSVCGE